MKRGAEPRQEVVAKRSDDITNSLAAFKLESSLHLN